MSHMRFVTPALHGWRTFVVRLPVDSPCIICSIGYSPFYHGVNCLTIVFRRFMMTARHCRLPFFRLNVSMLRNSAFLIACPFFIASEVLTGFPRCGYDKHRLLHPFMRHRLCSLSVFQAASPAISGTETYQRAEAHSVLTHPNFTRLSAIKGGKQQKKNCKFAKHPASLYNENSRAFHAPSRQQTAALFYGSSGG